MRKIILFLLVNFSLQAQNISGLVVDKLSKNPITGAIITGFPSKESVISDIDGKFLLNNMSDSKLIVGFVFYKNDTILVKSRFLKIELVSNSDLETVEITARSSSLDELSAIHTEILNSKTLSKAACCNLSESFETNASVSVNYTDAVTGAKQIQMLGLSGNYIQTNVENIPTLRGLGYTYGLNYIPGTWIQSIDISKGVGSVLNGYENMAGALNIELKKTKNTDKLLVNTYFNSLGRAEINLVSAAKLSKKWSYAFLGHGSGLQTTINKNKDNFLDLPKYWQGNLINRVQYDSEKMMFQAGVKFLAEDRIGGDVLSGTDTQTFAPIYTFSNRTNRVEVFTKLAKLYQSKPYRGLGWIINGTFHDSKTAFGFKQYTGLQKTLYSNLIYQDIIGNTNHTYKTGISYLLDSYNEIYAGNLYERLESVPGVFAEYSYKYLTKFNAVLGARYDQHNLYGKQFTPRLHLKYDIDANTIIRASIGRGFKVANIIAENQGYLVSSRALRITEALKPEVSWTMGGSIYKEFGLFGSKMNLTLDFFRTQFQNQVVIDVEHKGFLYAYNLDGQSFSNSFQSELNVFPSKQLELKLAYRYLDVRQSLGKPFGESVLIPKMFINPHRVLFNAGYNLPYDKWKFDFTTQWNGTRRIPELSPNYVHDSYKNMPIILAPAFFNFNAQITRTFKKGDVYIGGENLGNFTQKNPIISPESPFSNNFDAGMAWGPIVGRVIYVGMRYKIKAKKE